MIGRLIVLLLLTMPVSLRQDVRSQAGTDPWAPLRFIVGSWRGTNAGQPGEGTSERTYQFEFDGTFLVGRNKAVYPPQPANAKGETHQDTGFFSYDKARKKLVLRQFHSEGFVNQYVVDELAADGKSITFVTESIENIPPGWRASERYRITGPDEFVETFELCAPGKACEVYAEGRFRRVK